MGEVFAERMDIAVPSPEISVMYDVPEGLRNYLCLLMFKYGVGGLKN